MADEPVQHAEEVREAEAALESMAWLLTNLEPLVSFQVYAHLKGVRDWVRRQHRALLNDGCQEG